MAAPVKRRSKDSGEASTDSLALLQLKGFHPAIPLILSRKKFAKRAQFLTKWLEFSAPDGRLHPMFNNTRVATGRLSSSNPNCQQITLDLRSLFIAD
jgi:DNA polymerase-1